MDVKKTNTENNFKKTNTGWPVGEWGESEWQGTVNVTGTDPLFIIGPWCQDQSVQLQWKFDEQEQEQGQGQEGGQGGEGGSDSVDLSICLHLVADGGDVSFSANENSVSPSLLPGLLYPRHVTTNTTSHFIAQPYTFVEPFAWQTTALHDLRHATHPTAQSQSIALAVDSSSVDDSLDQGPTILAITATLGPNTTVCDTAASNNTENCAYLRMVFAHTSNKSQVPTQCEPERAASVTMAASLDEPSAALSAALASCLFPDELADESPAFFTPAGMLSVLSPNELSANMAVRTFGEGGTVTTFVRVSKDSLTRLYLSYGQLSDDPLAISVQVDVQSVDMLTCHPTCWARGHCIVDEEGVARCRCRDGRADHPSAASEEQHCAVAVPTDRHAVATQLPVLLDLQHDFPLHSTDVAALPRSAQLPLPRHRLLSLSFAEPASPSPSPSPPSLADLFIVAPSSAPLIPLPLFSHPSLPRPHASLAFGDTIELCPKLSQIGDVATDEAEASVLVVVRLADDDDDGEGAAVRGTVAVQDVTDSRLLSPSATHTVTLSPSVYTRFVLVANASANTRLRLHPSPPNLSLPASASIDLVDAACAPLTSHSTSLFLGNYLGPDLLVVAISGVASAPVLVILDEANVTTASVCPTDSEGRPCGRFGECRPVAAASEQDEGDVCVCASVHLDPTTACDRLRPTLLHNLTSVSLGEVVTSAPDEEDLVAVHWPATSHAALAVNVSLADDTSTATVRLYRDPAVPAQTSSTPVASTFLSTSRRHALLTVPRAGCSLARRRWFLHSTDAVRISLVEVGTEVDLAGLAAGESSATLTVHNVSSVNLLLLNTPPALRPALAITSTVDLSTTSQTLFAASPASCNSVGGARGFLDYSFVDLLEEGDGLYHFAGEALNTCDSLPDRSLVQLSLIPDYGSPTWTYNLSVVLVEPDEARCVVREGADARVDCVPASNVLSHCDHVPAGASVTFNAVVAISYSDALNDPELNLGVSMTDYLSCVDAALGEHMLPLVDRTDTCAPKALRDELCREYLPQCIDQTMEMPCVDECQDSVQAECQATLDTIDDPDLLSLGGSSAFSPDLSFGCTQQLRMVYEQRFAGEYLSKHVVASCSGLPPATSSPTPAPTTPYYDGDIGDDDDEGEGEGEGEGDDDDNVERVLPEEEDALFTLFGYKITETYAMIGAAGICVVATLGMLCCVIARRRAKTRDNEYW